MIDYIAWASLALAPITGIITWIAGRKQREQEFRATESDTLAKMQSTIDLLVSQNKSLYEEILELRRQVANLTLELDIQKNPNA